jgi:hypothetical protein
VRFWPGFSHESATSARGTLRFATSARGTLGIATSARKTLRIATSRALGPDARPTPAPTPAGRTADFPPVQHMVTGMQRRVRFLDCDVRAGPPASMPAGPVVKWAEFHNIVF